MAHPSIWNHAAWVAAFVGGWCLISLSISIDRDMGVVR